MNVNRKYIVSSRGATSLGAKHVAFSITFIHMGKDSIDCEQSFVFALNQQVRTQQLSEEDNISNAQCPLLL